MSTSLTFQPHAIVRTALAVALTAGFALAATSTFAQEIGAERFAAPSSLGKTAALDAAAPDAHLRREPQPASRRPPQSSPDARRADYDLPDDAAHKAHRPSASIAKAVCDTSVFASATGASLVAAIKGASTECVNSLFGLSGSTAYGAFREAQMVTVANALQSAAASYNGTNASGILQLILYLRAGYYVQFYDTAVGSYGTSLVNAIRPAMDAFAGSSSFGLVNDAHGEILSEFMTLIDSSTQNARYLYVVKRLLASYNPSTFAPYYWMNASVNSSFYALFRGHQVPEFVTLVQSDTSIVDTLYNFANNHFSQLGGDNGYLVSNAGRELGRFLQYTGSLKSLAQSRARTLLERSSVTGASAPLWVGIGEMVEWYDKANCGYYNLCDFVARVEAAALPITHNCSSTLRLRAQSMSASELASTCTTVAGQENYFHTKLATNRTPVANDNNAALEMVIFDSSTDYGTYAGALFGIDTNNGGMYLEGDPSVAGNQARFIAYEAEWVRPTFEIWNLTHEYVHYLDGRYDMYGDFGAAMTQKTVWWVEGLAEYLSYSYRNLAYTAAVDEAAAGTYALSRVFQNDYNSGTTLVYRWGYLGVRYMFEQKPADVASILALMRPGNYTGYASFMSGLGTRYDAGFRTFLACVANPASTGCGGTPNVPPTANFGFATNALTATFTDGSTDSDGSIASRQWNFGDGSTSTATNPSKTYAAAGTYTVSLTVTDDRGGTATTTRNVTVAASTTGALQNGVAVTGLSGAANGTLAYTFDVPAGATNLRFAMSGGSGDADLYVRFGSAPTTSAYDCRPYAGGNAETCTIANVQAGRYHVLVRGYSAFSGVSLTASFTPPSTGLPECTNADVRVLGKNCQRGNASATQGNYAHFYLNIPAGTAQLRITTSGGTGDANLYGNTASWAYTTSWTQRSTNAGNGEAIVVNNPPAGYYYVSLHAASGFSGVTVRSEY
ncbi:collagenase [Tahibacter soli]|uniref:microbial collagenase n=1 Tax=Tahibacter soli TaxID=2983605 RepID=A0A9X4BJX9_9GAMM|nr:collagenase [Tahibacter soli]MDC8012629.1 collagenase [Tahibacter soli]